MWAATIQMFLALGVVLALAFIFLKFLLPKWIKAGSKKSTQMEILEVQRLGVRRDLILVRVQNRKFLLGATDHGVHLIAEIARDGGENSPIKN
jgi:flagellar biosynthetic protein FliO